MRPRVAESTETASPPLVPARRRPFASTICPRGAGRTPRRRGMRTVRRREGWVTKSLRPVLCRVLAKHARLETPLPSDFRRRLMTREGKGKTRCKKGTFARAGRPVAAGPVGRLAAQMNLERVITALAPTDVVQRAPVEIFDLAYDTRAVEPGALFFCVSGERHDGHGFAREAVQKGAVALVVERTLELDVPQIVVQDSRRAMAQAAVVFFGDPTRELEVAGVTGTNGKTTTAFLLHSILEAAGRRPGLLGTIETRIGGVRRAAVRAPPPAVHPPRAFP